MLYIYICIYISQRKYISNFTTIHALSPYRSSHTITPATCVYIGLILTSITSIVCAVTYDKPLRPVMYDKPKMSHKDSGVNFVDFGEMNVISEMNM